MSGHKRLLVSLGSPDSKRMKELMRRIQAIENDSDKLSTKVQNLHETEVHQMIDELHQRQNHYIKNLSDLNINLQQTEARTAQSIVDQSMQFEEEIQQLGSEIWNNTSLIYGEQNRMFDQILQEHHSNIQAELLNLRHHFEQNDKGIKNKELHVQEVIEDAQNLITVLTAQYDYNLYLPGFIEQEIQILDQAQTNCWNGFFEAGLALVQQSLFRLSNSRIHIEREILEHELFYNNVLTSCNEVFSLLVQIENVEALDLDGNPVGNFLNVNYWSWGAYEDHFNEMKAVRNFLLEKGKDISVSELREISDRIQEIQQSIPNMIAHARENILGSQIRFNIAELIIEALKIQGFACANAYYENNDQRLPYQTTLVNFEGSEVDICISPDIQMPLNHTVDLYSNDAEIRTTHELKQRAKALRDTLRNFGIDANLQIPKEPISEPEPKHQPKWIKENPSRETIIRIQ
jgi:hypothetical protein